MLATRAAVYEREVTASDARRRAAADQFTREVEARARIMHGHHAALQVHLPQQLRALFARISKWPGIAADDEPVGLQSR